MIPIIYIVTMILIILLLEVRFKPKETNEIDFLIGWTSIPKADDDDGYGDVDDDGIPASPLLRATPQERNSR